MSLRPDSTPTGGYERAVRVLARTDLTIGEIAHRLDLSEPEVEAVLDSESTVPRAFSVQPHHLRNARIGLGIATVCSMLARHLAAEQGIEDPEEEWVCEMADWLQRPVEDGVLWTAIESPAEWKASKARAER